MKKINPLVSVIIPVYNCAQFISQALDSVLNQPYRPIEIIVVDDGSTDNSRAVIKRYLNAPITYFYQSNQGISNARNRGASLSSGDYLAFIDSDDVWTQTKLTLQMAVFHNNKIVDMVFGHVIQFYDLGNNFSSEDELPIDNEGQPGYLPGTMLIKRDTFFQVGLFDTEYRVGEYIDWYIRAIEIGLTEIMLPEVVLKRRIHESNIGIRARNCQTDYLRILKAKLDRRTEKDKVKPHT